MANLLVLLEEELDEIVICLGNRSLRRYEQVAEKLWPEMNSP